jgi:hypothetical protein
MTGGSVSELRAGESKRNFFQQKQQAATSVSLFCLNQPLRASNQSKEPSLDLRLYYFKPLRQYLICQIKWLIQNVPAFPAETIIGVRTFQS